MILLLFSCLHHQDNLDHTSALNSWCLQDIRSRFAKDSQRQSLRPELGPWKAGWCFGLAESCSQGRSCCRWTLHSAPSQNEEGSCSSSSPRWSPESQRTDPCWSPEMPGSQTRERVKRLLLLLLCWKQTNKQLLFFTRTVRVIGPMMSAALVMVMFPVSSSIWKIFPSFPDVKKWINTRVVQK